jgi:hypothetical protein
MTLFWIGLFITAFCLVALQINKSSLPVDGHITLFSIENHLTCWIQSDTKCLNTYLLDYGGIVSIKLPPGNYRCEYKASSGKEGTILIDLKISDNLKIQLPPQ